MPADLQTLHREYMDNAEFVRQLSPKTLRMYRSSFDLVLKHEPTLTAEMLTAEHFATFFKWLQTRRRIFGGFSQSGVKKSTVATHWKNLSKFLAWLKAKQVVRSNPFRDGQMEPPRVRYDDRKYLNRDQLRRLFVATAINIPWANAFTRTRNLAILSTGLNCGLRRSELLELKMSDLDFGRKELTVRGATSKSQSTRIVPLNSQVLMHMQEYLSQRSKRLYTCPYIWTSATSDGRLTSDGLRHVISLIVENSGVKFHLHQLRHTFAVNFLMNSGQNSFKLQGLMGHRSIASTAIYTRALPPEAVRREIERMGNLDNAL